MSKVITFNNKTLMFGSIPKCVVARDNPNPLNLPPYTMRVKLNEQRPIDDFTVRGATTAVVLDNEQHIYEFTYESTNWLSFFYNYKYITDVLGANLTGVVNLREVFSGASNLVSVCLFDTESVTTMQEMFRGCVYLENCPEFITSSVNNMKGLFSQCYSLKRIHNLDTHNVTDMSSMLNNCQSLEVIPELDVTSVTDMRYMCTNTYKVRTGALALYQAASAKQPAPSHNGSTFGNCGRDTVSGAAELAQIPTSWGGTMS